MFSKRFDISKISVASPCSVPWERMAGDERSRYCDSCELSVYNISGMSTNEIEELVANRGRPLCIKLFRRGDGTVVTRDCPVGVRNRRKQVSRFVGAVFASLLGFLSVTYAQKDDRRSDDVTRVRIERTKSASAESEFAGTIVDPNGALVPGARINILLGAKVKYTAETSDDGTFTIPGVLPANNYKLAIISSGFKTFKLDRLKIGTEERLKMALSLEIDGETVVGIFIDDPLLETTSPSITHKITRRQIENLPIGK